MFRKSSHQSRSLDVFILTLVLFLIVATMVYVFRLSLAEVCYLRSRNNQIFTERVNLISTQTAVTEESDVVVVEGLHENEIYEGNHQRRILLLGDSILENRVYVASGSSVYDVLKGMSLENGYEIKMFAEDGATIGHVLLQLNRLPIDYNTESTALVLSVGGNDFLSGSDASSAEVAYTHLITRIRSVFGESKLYLVNLYQPVDPLFSIYETIVLRWNTFLKQMVKDGVADGIVDVYSLITNQADLVHRIEPSAIGGAKIARAILQTVEK